MALILSITSPDILGLEWPARLAKRDPRGKAARAGV